MIRLKKALEARFLPNDLFVKKDFRERMGFDLNLDNPKSFSEKIQWLKLYYKNPILPTLADKYESKKIVEKEVGIKYVMPTHAIYNDANDILLDKLPKKVALKATHASGINIISFDKSELDEKKVQSFFKHHLKKSYYLHSKEWAYKYVKPRVIAEELILEVNNELPKDYKIHCFSGIPRYIQVDHQRYKNHTRSYYDEYWSKKEFSHAKPIHQGLIDKPKSLDEMFEICKKLSKNLPYIRVDFFYVNNNIYVGELTCYPGNGMEPFSDYAWDLRLGELLVLPKKWL